MNKFLPFIFLVAVLSIFGIIWIVWYIDPDTAPWYIFAILVALVFVASLGLIGTLLYYLRTKFYRRYSPRWYFNTSFKMALFVSGFLALIAGLAILQLATPFNLFLSISAIALFAVWSYLGKKIEK